jgi:apolipoprotein N-acyltransferase
VPAAGASAVVGRTARGDAGTDETSRRRRVPWRTLLALGGGLALLLSFPGFHLPALAVLAPAALALAVRGQRFRSGLWLGLVLGLAFFVPVLSWTGVYVGSLPWLALAAAEAVNVALLGGAAALTSRLPLAPLWTACLWVAEEAVRGRFPFGGFPWGRLGLSQTSGPLLSLAAYGGVPLVTFAVALLGALLAAAAVTLARAWRSSGDDVPGTIRPAALRTAALLVAGVLAVPALAGLAWLPLPGSSLTAGGPSRAVAVIQGNVPRAGLDFNAQRRAVLDNHVRATIDLAAQVRNGDAAQPDLVIWPENSSDIDPFDNADAATQIDRAAIAIGAPILVGAVVDGPGRYASNTAIVWDPLTGPGQTYVKRHPVPFAEYIPDRAFFRLFSDKVDLVRQDFRAGARPGTLDVDGARIGDVICFEIAYDGIVRDVVRHGTGVLVVQTNNATFGFTDESEQQLAISRVRAVEHGRSVVIAATSGISAVIAPDGTVARSSSLFTPDAWVSQIAQRRSTTVADRVGAVPEWVLTGLGVAALVAVLTPRQRRRVGRGRRMAVR